MDKDQQAYWNSRASKWGEYDEPLIPSQPELDFQRRQIVPGGKTLVLGATPQLCALALESNSSVTAVDFAEDTVEALRINGVDYICQDWLDFFRSTKTQYDNIITDGGFGCMKFPDDWRNLAGLIYDHLQPGGIFTPRIYLSTNNPPKNHYDNPNLARFVSGIARVDDNWMMRVATHEDYAQYDVSYAFPPREVVLSTFGQFTLENEFIPSYEEGDRFVTFVFRRPVLK